MGNVSLKILVVIEKNTWMDIHLANSLESMGHIVTRFYYGDCIGEFYGVSRHNERKKKNNSLFNLVKNLKKEQDLNLIFCCVYDDFLLPKYAKALSMLNIPMVNYNVDMPTHWFRQIRTAKYFDIVLCAHQNNMGHLKKYAKKVLYFPMAAQQSHLIYTASQLEKKYDVTFLGMAYPYRQQILSELIKSDIPLFIFGKNWNSDQSNVYVKNISETLYYMFHYAWPRFKAEGLISLWKAFLNRFCLKHDTKPIPFIPQKAIKGVLSQTELSALFYQSKINIGFTRYANFHHNKPGQCQMKLRDFEVPMAGGFYLVEKAPGYEQEFIDGEEVVTWKTTADLLEKIRYYLKHDIERDAIALRGQKRALQDHTWEKRFNILFVELVFLNKNGG